MSRVTAGGVNWHFVDEGDRHQVPLLLVHGFTGSIGSWDQIIGALLDEFHVLRVDLPGHGGSPVPRRPLNLAETGNTLCRFAEMVCDSPPILGGYSMGGRVALHALVSASARFRGAILIGASPGIENETERVARLDADRQLAAQIRDCGIEWFVDCWESLPIFASQRRLPVKIATALHAQRLANEPEGLAYALENWSPGAQEWLLPRLDRIQASVCLMAGALDREYVESNRSMRSAMNQTTAECIEIPDAGHAPQIEQPLALAEAIIRFKQKTRIDE